jgi:hypothetical protein
MHSWTVTIFILKVIQQLGSFNGHYTIFILKVIQQLGSFNGHYLKANLLAFFKKWVFIGHPWVRQTKWTATTGISAWAVGDLVTQGGREGENTLPKPLLGLPSPSILPVAFSTHFTFKYLLSNIVFFLLK